MIMNKQCTYSDLDTLLLTRTKTTNGCDNFNENGPQNQSHGTHSCQSPTA